MDRCIDVGVVGVSGRLGEIGRMSDVDKNLESKLAGTGSWRLLDFGAEKGKLGIGATEISLSKPRIPSLEILKEKLTSLKQFSISEHYMLML